jgi:hypothetical protein
VVGWSGVCGGVVGTGSSGVDTAFREYHFTCLLETIKQLVLSIVN